MKKRTTTMAGVIVATLALGACQSRESRVEAALLGAGLSPTLSTCLAPRLSNDLSDDQLRALAEAARTTDGGRANPRAVIARVAATGDPRIIDVASSALLACALRR